MVPEEKRKRNGRVNGSPNSNTSKLAAPEEKRKRNGRVNGGSVQNTGPGRKTEEKRKGKRKRVIHDQREKIVVFLWISFPCAEHAPHTGRLFLPERLLLGSRNRRLDRRANERQHLFVHNPTSLWTHARVCFRMLRFSNLHPIINGRKTEDKLKLPGR